MKALTDKERALLEKLADAGQPTELSGDELTLGKMLEKRGLVFFMRDSALAVIMPKGRHALTGEEEPKPARRSRLSTTSVRR